MRSTRRLAATLTLLTLLAGCQPPEPETPTATVAASTTPALTPTPTALPSPSPTPSPSPEDYTVPAVIDEAYIQRVLNALYNLESEAVREMVAAQEVTAETEAALRALYREELVEPYLQSYRESADDNFPEVLQTPGLQIVLLEQVISAKSDCIFVRASRDFSEVLVNPESQAGTTFVQFLPKTPDQDPARLNPTPWIIGGSVLRPDNTSPEDQCADF